MRPFHLLIAVCLGLLSPTGALAQDSAETSVEGVVLPGRRATLSFAVNGVVGAIHFAEGDKVRENDVIVELASAAEALNAERRRLVMEGARREFERNQRIRSASQALSQEELEKSESAFQIAKAEYELALAELEMRKLRAPFEGWITNLNDLEKGEGAQALTPLLQVADLRVCEFVCHTTPESLAGYKVGDELPLLLKSDRGTLERTGKIRHLSPLVDAASGLLRLHVTFENNDLSLRPGMGGSVRLRQRGGHP
jgi:membrane fusion protein (multidrug efflux system)